MDPALSLDEVTAAAEPVTQPAPRWQAHLDLRFAPAGTRTVLRERCHTGPLAVQRAFYPEGNGDGPCHVYILHPPGGLVGGDELTIDVVMESGGHALLTTPAATKAYRSADDVLVAHQTQRLRVAPGAALEWLPQESILFNGARLVLNTRVDLDGDAAFIGWEVLCLGRPACDEAFARGRLTQRFEVWRDGRPLAIERATIDGGAPVLAAAWGLRGAPVTGTMYSAPAPAGGLDDIRSALADLPGGELAAASLLDGVLVCRYLGPSPERARDLFARVWSMVRPVVLGRPAVRPRIWMT